jgi:hypothetical protein
MQNFFLRKIRLSWYFIIFLATYGILAITLPEQKFDSGALTLFSVNSFLYGFYIAPIMSGQKARVEELHRVVRSEANAIFAMAIRLKKLPDDLRNKLQKELTEYLEVSSEQQRIAEGEKEYEDLITLCLDHKGGHREEVDKLLNDLIENQKNRTQFSMMMSNRVFSHEWIVILVLFTITLGFVLMIDVGSSPVLLIIKAFLCTGLSMLLIILAKLSTLTHKKARQIWDPYKKLISTHFYRID